MRNTLTLLSVIILIAILEISSYAQSTEVHHKYSVKEVIDSIKTIENSIIGLNAYSYKNTNLLAKDEVITPRLDSIVTDLIWEKIEYQYQQDSVLTLYSHFTKPNEEGSWFNDYRYEYERNDFDKVVKFLKVIWDLENEVWINDFRSERKYDSQQNEIEYLRYNWNNILKDWELDYKEERKFDLLGNRTYYVKYNWNAANSKWVPSSSKIIDEFDDIGNALMYSTYIWDELSESWVGTYKTSIDPRDELNRLTYYAWYEWDYEVNDWYKVKYFEYEYDGLSGVCLVYANDNDSWVLNDKYEYIYDTEFRTLSEIDFYLKDEVWRESGKKEYLYNGDTTTSIFYSAGVNNWLPQRKYIVLWYKTAIDYKEAYEWNNDNSSWVGNYKYLQTRNDKLQRTSYVNFEWDFESNAWVYATQVVYEYHDEIPVKRRNIFQSWIDNEWINTKVENYHYRKLDRNLDFHELPQKTYGDVEFVIQATSNNDMMPIYFSISDPAIASIVLNQVQINQAGQVQITAIQDANWLFNATSVVQTLNINKAPLNIGVSDTIRLFGNSNPEFNIQFNGFVNGDDVSDLETLPIATTTATIESPPGEYPITLSGAESVNYDFLYEDGFLIIEGITLATDNSKNNTINVYPNPTVRFVKIDGLENIESIHLLDINGKVLLKFVKPDGNTFDLKTLNAGAYILQINTGTSTNKVHLIKD
ncbi:MBG domain-containing protein [Fulvivirga lutimaris]|uniref:MBG domain-containing protein n=1 Tax=Fulvivirga lutimaris TaxID=1819566 RepID=UPI0012BC61C1|nr:MBG domain-containing protein [Fulvivirga lutimaris]MTI38704.1 T9SS type A sorting domain-containing protein [Fulvivirga lutimaris]